MTPIKNPMHAFITAAAIGLSIVATAGSAHAYGKKTIDDERAAEQARIEQGRYDGQITRREYRDLLAEQERIKRLENQAISDGQISKREFRHIREAQQQASGHIYKDSHNGQVSWYRRWLYNHRY